MLFAYVHNIGTANLSKNGKLYWVLRYHIQNLWNKQPLDVEYSYKGIYLLSQIQTMNYEYPRKLNFWILCNATYFLYVTTSRNT